MNIFKITQYSIIGMTCCGYVGFAVGFKSGYNNYYKPKYQRFIDGIAIGATVGVISFWGSPFVILTLPVTIPIMILSQK